MTLILSGAAFANSQTVGKIDADTLSENTLSTPSVTGITFDDIAPGQPIVGTNSGLHLGRLDPTTAAITHLYNLPYQYQNTCRGLDYIGGGLYYETRGQPNALYTLDPLAGTATQIGTDLGGGVYNFLDTAIDPTTGRLWAISGNNGGELLEINRITGAATHKGYISDINLVVSLAIDPAGNFFVSNVRGSDFLENQIFQLDPNTMATTLRTGTGFSGADYLADFAFDPTSQQWFGVIEQRSSPTRQWLLINLTNVPEPCTAFLAAAVLPVFVHRRKGFNPR